MSDDGNRHGHLPTAGGGGTKFLGQRFRDHGERPNGVTFMGRCAHTAQLHASFAAQLTQMREEQEGREGADRAALRTALEECRASARDARVARAQLRDQQDEFEERVRVEAAESLTRLEARLFFHTLIAYL